MFALLTYWPVPSKLLLNSFVLQIPVGRSCVSHYRELSRYCVFSHDEMVCNMASKAEAMDVDLAAVVQKEMNVIVEQEDKLREMIKKMVSIWSSVCFSIELTRYVRKVLYSSYLKSFFHCKSIRLAFKKFFFLFHISVIDVPGLVG